jgi:hypothetical protein
LGWDNGPGICRKKGVNTAQAAPGLRELSQFHAPTTLPLPAPHTAITTPIWVVVFNPEPQHLLARKQLSEFCLGWKGMSNGANCGAGRRGWEEAAERDHLACTNY